jgi:hypothetical protein
MGLWPWGSETADPEVLKPHVPPAQIEEARSWKNPFPGTPDNIQKMENDFSREVVLYDLLWKIRKRTGGYPRANSEAPLEFQG